MKQAKIKAEVTDVSYTTVGLEFGRIQGNLWISRNGNIGRAMKFKEGDKVEIIIRKVK